LPHLEQITSVKFFRNSAFTGMSNRDADSDRQKAEEEVSSFYDA
jgi:hypothetical protein